jgi:chemotaxis signal transduction protein
MSLPVESESQSFVLLRLGERRFAIAAEQIVELVATSRVFRFPHQTPEIEGVIVRRGRIVPVCDVAERLIGKKPKARRLYLIAVRRYAGQAEWIALPVTGECELITAEMSPAGGTDSPHVAGWLSHAGDVIEVLHLEGLTPGPSGVAEPSTALGAEEARP